MNKLHPFGGKLLFECSYSANDVSVFAGTNTFLKDVLLSWASCNLKPAISSYRNEILWNNSCIKAGGCTIICKKWYQKGIKYFNDIYNDKSKTIYSYDRLKDLYQLPRKISITNTKHTAKMENKYTTRKHKHAHDINNNKSSS